MGILIIKFLHGDTIYQLSLKYGSSINSILAANPSVSPNSLRVGQIIIIPIDTIINTSIPMSYEVLKINLDGFTKVFPFLQISSIGSSALGNSIPVIKFGNGPKEIFYSASWHANEWITSLLLMKFIENLSLAFVNNSILYGANIRNLFNQVSLYIVPMVNPDGVNLVTGEYPANSQEFLSAQNIANNYPNIAFPSGWKANIRGVDLNLQFPAGWEQARQIKFEQGFTTPAPRDFVGDGPLVAPEAIAVYNFTLLHNFRLILAYHTQGKEIYWQFQDYAPEESIYIGQQFENASGYVLSETPYNSSFAGYKDWFLQDYRRPGFTIEAGLRCKSASSFSI